MDEQEENHYKWYLFYYNPDDPRLFVPVQLRNPKTYIPK
jgi:uncharacterized membrane protein